MKMRTNKGTDYLVFPVLLLLFAVNAKAQPGGTDQNFHIYFSLPPEIERQFEFGALNTTDLNLECKFYDSLGKRRGGSRSIFYEEATYAEPAQIHVEYSFQLEQYDFLILDSVGIRFKTDNKTYSTSLLPDENCIRDFTGEFQNQGYGKCKAKTRYPAGKRDPKKLSATIDQLKNNNNSRETIYPSSSKLLRVINSENEALYPLVIANGDTCDIKEGNGINANVLGFSWDNQKINLKIYHPDYPSLILDSVSRYGGQYDYVYLLKEDEDYYLDGGKRLPIEEGYKELAFWFEPGMSDQKLDSIVKVLTSTHPLELAKNWAKIIEEEEDSRGREFVESKYGGFDSHLKSVRHFRWKRDREFSHTYNLAKDFAEIRALQIPVSFHEYLIPRLTVHFKAGVSETEILQFEKDYLPEFDRIDFDTKRPEINLKSRSYKFSEWIYVPNHLQEKIMNDPRVKYCGGTLEQHTIID